jgi:hypothetical protein
MSEFQNESSSQTQSGSSDSEEFVREPIKLGQKPIETKIRRTDWKKQDGKWSLGEHKTQLGSDSRFDRLKEMHSKYDNEASDATGFRGSSTQNNQTLQGLAGHLKKNRDEVPEEKHGAFDFFTKVAESGPKIGEKEHVNKVTTRRLDTDSQDRLEVGFKDGKMVGSDGNNLDTTGATGFGGFGSKHEVAGRHIFGMDKTGTIRTGDAWGEGRLWKNDRSGADEGGVEMSWMNHSSLLNGKKAAGAGEMRVEDGQVKLVSDNSGHYTPDSDMMQQTVGHLEDHGVDLAQMTTEFVGKTGTGDHDLAGSKDGFASGKLQAGALELMSYQGDWNAEGKMREARRGRMGLMDSIRNFDSTTLRATGVNVDRSAPNLAMALEDGIAQQHETVPSAPPLPPSSSSQTSAPKRSLGEGIIDRIAQLKAAGLQLED